jgi:hypothetical protein
VTRRSDPVRIAAARRAAAIARLVSSGELPDRAAATIARWEAANAGPGDRADWESLDDWLRSEGTRRSPPETGER